MLHAILMFMTHIQKFDSEQCRYVGVKDNNNMIKVMLPWKRTFFFDTKMQQQNSESDVDRNGIYII